MSDARSMMRTIEEYAAEVERLRAERDAAIVERDEMRAANVTPEDGDRPYGQSVEYWQDRCLDHAAALDAARRSSDGKPMMLRLRESSGAADETTVCTDAGRAVGEARRREPS